ncbi:hypothetical protein PIB30_106873, partial [Stylosanthes scabra]|nr:hypothetical protein [Stylosanthes scabra]
CIHNQLSQLCFCFSLEKLVHRKIFVAQFLRHDLVGERYTYGMNRTGFVTMQKRKLKNKRTGFASNKQNRITNGSRSGFLNNKDKCTNLWKTDQSIPNLLGGDFHHSCNCVNGVVIDVKTVEELL